eukprot:GHVU01137104.1.p1 GENE.GHVU01137104.1~~GHVU01137104.1.p1  ORF type:complete len:195 (+),score=6.36 GHVU01137104.1:97-681(+)
MKLRSVAPQISIVVLLQVLMSSGVLSSEVERQPSAVKNAASVGPKPEVPNAGGNGGPNQTGVEVNVPEPSLNSKLYRSRSGHPTGTSNRKAYGSQDSAQSKPDSQLEDRPNKKATKVLFLGLALGTTFAICTGLCLYKIVLDPKLASQRVARRYRPQRGPYAYEPPTLSPVGAQMYGIPSAADAVSANPAQVQV